MKCPVCGNEIETGSQTCPWCESSIKRSRSTAKAAEKIRCKNIKSDLPTTETALNRLVRYLYGAKADGVRVLKIVHGYGSSGKGGDIKYIVREYLENQKYSPLFKYYVPGEEFCHDYDNGRKIVQQFPALQKDNDWNKYNKGITLIVL